MTIRDSGASEIHLHTTRCPSRGREGTSGVKVGGYEGRDERGGVRPTGSVRRDRTDT